MLTWARQLSGSPRPSHGPGVSTVYCPALACAPQGQTSVTSAKQGPKKEGELWPWAPRSHLPHFLVLAITQAFLTEPRIFAVVAESHVGMSQVLLRLKQWPRAEVMAPWTCQKVPLNASAPLCPTDMWPWQLLFQWGVRAFLCRRVLLVWHSRTTATSEVGVGFDLGPRGLVP